MFDSRPGHLVAIFYHLSLCCHTLHHCSLFKCAKTCDFGKLNLLWEWWNLSSPSPISLWSLCQLGFSRFCETALSAPWRSKALFWTLLSALAGPLSGSRCLHLKAHTFHPLLPLPTNFQCFMFVWSSIFIDAIFPQYVIFHRHCCEVEIHSVCHWAANFVIMWWP